MEKNFEFFDRNTGECFVVTEEDFVTATEIATQYWGDEIEFVDIVDNMEDIKED